MANSPQARKRARQNSVRRSHNMSQRSSLRSSIKKLIKAIATNDPDNAKQAYREATSNIDAAVSKGLHHKNRAARLKSRFNSKLKSLTS